MAQGSSNRWKLQDLQDLEQYGLAAELESTKLGGNTVQGDGAMLLNDVAFPSYDMSGVLSELLTEGGDFLTESLLTLPATPPPLLPAPVPATPQLVSAQLRAPTAHCIKNTEPELTYVQKGHSYELHVSQSHIGGDSGTEVIFKSVLLLTFSELRLKNCEAELFEQWINEHPMERLLEMDNVACDGVASVQNSEANIHTVSFTWSSLRAVIVAFKVNCLSSEFAARKHGGEKGIPLCLQLDTYCVNKSSADKTEDSGSQRLIERLACNIKVFKDKGAERKQRQEQLKMEKLSPLEQAGFHKSKNMTTLYPVQICYNVAMGTNQDTPTTLPPPVEIAPVYQVTTPPRPPPLTVSSPALEASTVEHAHSWLTANRFGRFLSLFANYSCQDLLRLSRRDLLDLCGAADGIRLYNALRSHTVKVIYITTGTEKICQAICLEHLTAQELGTKVADKLGISPTSVSSLVRLTSTGILVLVDDTVIHNIRDEEVFLVQTIKQEDDQYQVILQDHSPIDQSQISIRGTEFRH